MSIEQITNNTFYKLQQRYQGAIREDLEDSIQSSLLTYLQKFGNLTTITAPWLYTTAKNKFIDAMRKNKKAIPFDCLEADAMVEADGSVLTNIYLDTQWNEAREAANELRYSSND